MSFLSCLSCASGNQAEFGAEINIHFPGLRNIDRPSLLAFPKLLVCLDCGFSRFTLPETELRLLREPVTDELSALTNRLHSG
jgi:hypothetical protein